MPAGQNRASHSRGRSGENTDKGDKGSIEVFAMQNPSGEDKVVMMAPIHVDMDSRQKKRTMIKNAYAAATKTAFPTQMAVARPRVESSEDLRPT